MTIHEHGFWEDTNLDNHIFDESLCKSIIKFLKEHNIESIIDIGCGHGEYTKNINYTNILCVGYDGNPNTNELTNGLCYVKDFSIPQTFSVLFDYALCLEVAEHIPKNYEDTFIQNLINCNCKGIILSWAITGQGGHGHVNERDNDYVIDLIQSYGYTYNKIESDKLRGEATLFWFKNTLLIFQKN